MHASKLFINPQIGFEINIPRGNGKDYVIHLGYSLAHIDTDWKSKSCDEQEKCTSINSFWTDSDNSNIDRKTYFISIGIKNWNINNKFW